MVFEGGIAKEELPLNYFAFLNDRFVIKITFF